MDSASFLVKRQALYRRLDDHRVSLLSFAREKTRVLGYPIGGIGKVALLGGALLGWRKWAPKLLLTLGRPYVYSLMRRYGFESLPKQGLLDRVWSWISKK